MRRALIALSFAFLAMTATGGAASVLLPEGTPALDTQTPASGSDTSQSVQSGKSAPLVAPTPPAVTTKSSASSENASQIDQVNNQIFKAFESAKSDSATAAVLKDITTDDLKALSGETVSPELMKKLSAISKSTSMSSSLGVKGAVSITPGGLLGKKPSSKEDVMTAQMLQAGVVVRDTPDSPMVAEAKRVAAEARKLHERSPVYLDDMELSPSAADTYQKPFTISVTNDYYWGEDDIKKITASLGYARDDIPKNCQLRLKMELVTTDNYASYNMYVFSNEQKTGSMNGRLTSLQVKPVAVCYPPANPPRKGMVILKHGDKNAVLIGEGSCDVPKPKNPSEVFEPVSAGIRYMGDGTINCAFK